MRIDTFDIYYSKAVDKSVNTTQADVMCERCVFCGPFCFYLKLI